LRPPASRKRKTMKNDHKPPASRKRKTMKNDHKGHSYTVKLLRYRHP
jgi:hypothetical protein